MLRILHFADTHIDIANHGRRDPETGLSLRVLDFLRALDTIVDTAIAEKVDLVLFAGDAYKDRTPAPTFQREWGRRIMRLSLAGIPTLLLVGNHDVSPTMGRAHTLQEFETLQVPGVKVLSRPVLLKPEDLGGLPVQIIALPWVTRSGLMANRQTTGESMDEINRDIEDLLIQLIYGYMNQLSPDYPAILTAHGTVQGAMYGAERSVMLGNDVVLPGSLVRDSRLDYVALGHIHKAQNINENAHPPVVYPGSIERVDFGEARDDKYFVIANVERGSTTVEWRKLNGRRFIVKRFRPENALDLTEQCCRALPPQDELANAIVRLEVEYPREWEDQLDKPALRRYAESAFEFHLIPRAEVPTRLRLPEDRSMGSLTALELLDIYWKSLHLDDKAALESLNRLASEIIASQNVGNQREE